jgi:hypothetical protein
MRKKIHIPILEPEPDTRPVGPFVDDTSGWGNRNPLSGGALYESGVMSARSGGNEAPWSKGVRTVSSRELARGSNPIREREGKEEDGDEKHW